MKHLRKLTLKEKKMAISAGLELKNTYRTGRSGITTWLFDQKNNKTHIFENGIKVGEEA